MAVGRHDAAYNAAMVALRCLYLIALIFWVGGMVALGALGAPAVFDVLEAHHGLGGRIEAGAVFGEMLRRFRFFDYGSATVLLGCLVALYRRTPRPTALGIRIVTVVAMLGVSLYAGFGITGQIEAVQVDIQNTVASLGDNSQFAARFDSLHALTTSLLLLNLGGGLSLIYWEARARIA
ncbi:MAG: DUF4149 domain-containing protein [Vicinamibacterales bacterium]|jgi:hypothetical protein|nr:DUF4149 domain-containing protein [Vicinamibacterales bacterium]|tara:strand:- start:69 stop:605 length:537 start_codon:yes stop_codon:yes gene_type:complete